MKLICTLLVFFSLAVVFIATNSVVQEKGEINGVLEAEVTALKNERNELLIEKAALSSPKRVEDVAKNTLGMVKATQEQILYYHTKENKEEKKSD